MKFSIEISADEIKPVAIEEHQFDCRHEANFIAPFRIFRIIRILMQVAKPTIFQGNCLPLLKSFQLRKTLLDEIEQVFMKK